MLFQSYEFAGFFLLVLLAFYAVPLRFGRFVLLAASYYFYWRWNHRYIVFLGALTLSDYLIALALERTEAPRARRLLAAFGVGANLAFLGTLKYVNFVSGTVAALAGLAHDPWTLAWLVPIGISFHTFQSISYVVDVYARRTRAERNPVDYALYIAFFPQLLAGPIVRAGRFFRELHGWHAPAGDDVQRGVWEIVAGLVKKTVLADHFASVSDAYFGAVGAHPGFLAASGGVLAFTLQIYFDFSGYSDIAIGCARLLGFAFPENFRRPYLAWSISDFWRRWHVSLSSWLRDYLYIPLGGSRHGTAATLRNLLVTMLLGGLWHGANWTFVAWGAYHGTLLCVERLLGIGRPGDAPHGVRRVVATVLTVTLAAGGWILFRAQSFGEVGAVLHGFVAGAGTWPLAPWTLACAALFFAFEVARERGLVVEPWRDAPPLARAGGLATMLLALELLSQSGEGAPFIYFRF